MLFACLWRIFLHMCSIVFIKLLTIEHEEVATQHGTDALQQYRVDSLALEDVINVGTITVEALGQPRCTAPLTAQLSFNFFPDMNHHSRPDLLQQFPAATWLIFHQHENKTSSLLPVLTFNLIIWNLAREVPNNHRKNTTREGIVLPYVLIKYTLLIENQTHKKNSDFILIKYSDQS